MFKPLCIASAATLLLATNAAAQTATDQTETEGTAQEEAPPPPEYNGTITGTTSGSSLNAQVVCEGFDGGGPVTIKSDPGDIPGQDLNGDGTIVDISASPDGNISINLTNANSVFSMNDSTAELDGNTLRYQIEMTFAGGITETIEVTANCQ